MATELHTSPSSMHLAFTRLEEAGAIQFETRGRAGAFLLDRSLGQLWTIAEGGPLVIALPLASSPRYEALATAIKQLITAAGIEVFFLFARGSRQRLQAMHDGRCHLAVMSSFAASEICVRHDCLVTELLPNSYNTGHRVFYAPDRAGSDPLRVIVDRYSADQQLLTTLEFEGINVVHVPAMTSQIVRLLEHGHADTAVWTIDEMETRTRPGILDRPLSPVVRDRIGDRDTRTVFVGMTDHAPILRAATSMLDGQNIHRIQSDVLAGRTVPEY